MQTLHKEVWVLSVTCENGKHNYLAAHPSSVDWFLIVISLIFKELLSGYEALL